MQLDHAKDAQDREEIPRDPRPARRALSEVLERAGDGDRRVRSGARVRSGEQRARRDARGALRERRRRSTSTRRSRRRRRSSGAIRTASRATSSFAASTPKRSARTPRGASARRSACSTSPSPTKSASTRHRADNAAPAQAVMTEDDWRKLAHVDDEPLLTRIFAMIQPTIIRARTQPLEAIGYDPRYAIDPSLHPYPGVADALLREGRARDAGRRRSSSRIRTIRAASASSTRTRRRSSSGARRSRRKFRRRRWRSSRGRHLTYFRRATTCVTSCRRAPA